MKIFLFAAVVTLFSSVAFADDLYVATASGTIKGKITGFVLVQKSNTKKLVAAAAETANIPSSQLLLVYNTTADALQVVNKADGTPVTTIFSISGGTTIASDGDNFRVRYANVTFPGSGAATGTVAGDISITRDDSGVSKFSWGATVQGTAQFDTGTSSGVVTGIYRGTFTSGKRFTPKP